MNSTFISPRFSGDRFDGGLPLEVARDLAAYQDLIRDLARHLYLMRNPTRQRTPKNFDQSFSLQLQGLEEGSTLTKLASIGVPVPGLTVPASTYFDDARDLAAECVRAKAENRPRPKEFPRILLSHFNIFGRSLRPGESVDITADPNRPAVLTPERRQALVLEAQDVFRKEVSITGTVSKNAWDQERFTLRPLAGPTVEVHLPGKFREIVRSASGNARTLLSLQGVAELDAAENIRAVVEIIDLTPMPNLAFNVSFDRALNVDAGWLDGEGLKPDQALRDWLEENLIATYPEHLPFPRVAPTPEGGVYMEWIDQPWRVSVEFTGMHQPCELLATNAREKRAEELEVDDFRAADWKRFYAFVSDFIPPTWAFT